MAYVKVEAPGLLVKCPQCGALPGKPCRNSFNRTLKGVHQKRRKAWEKHLDKTQD